MQIEPAKLIELLRKRALFVAADLVTLSPLQRFEDEICARLNLIAFTLDVPFEQVGVLEQRPIVVLVDELAVLLEQLLQLLFDLGQRLVRAVRTRMIRVYGGRHFSLHTQICSQHTASFDRTDEVCGLSESDSKAN